MHDWIATAGSLKRTLHTLDPEDSIGRAAEMLRSNSTGVIPITSFGYPAGVLDERALRGALEDGASPDGPLSPFMRTDFIRLRVDTTEDEVREALEATDLSVAVVEDHDGAYVGVVGAADLLARDRQPIRPPVIGGMATPLGVYLSTGVVDGGKRGVALMLSGALLFVAYILANSIVAGAAWLLQTYGGVHVFDWALAPPPSGVAHWVGLGTHGLVLVLFLVILRSIPLAGIHAAEHKVVHAIERGERLTPEVVERMPRVHPRCGTNIAVGAAIFLALAGIEYGPDWRELGLLFALIATLILWRPVGQLVQAIATTKPPTRKQVLQAIDAGEELLERTQRAGNPRAPFLGRLTHSGLPQILLGVITVALLAQLFEWATGLSIPLLA